MSPRRLETIALCLAGGIAWAAPFLLDVLWPVVFVGLVPFLYLVGSGRYGRILLPSYLLGAISLGLGAFWIGGVWLPLPLVPAAYFALYTALSGWAIARARRRTSLPLVAIAPPIFVAAELLRLEVSFFRTTWLNLAYPLHDSLDLIQISRWTGHFGVSALVVLLNAAIAESIISGIRSRRAIASIAIALVALGGSLGYGALTDVEEDSPDGPVIGIIQGNITQDRIIHPSEWAGVLKTYIGLTERLGGDGVDLWVWPESSCPGRISNHPQASKAILSLARGLDTPIIFGSIGIREKDDEKRPTNSAFLVSREGSLVGRYDKRVLVPFGETLPIIGEIRALRRPIADFLQESIGFRPHILPGEKGTPLEIPHGGGSVRLGMLICYEDVLPDLARRARADGAEILINTSNEAWFPDRELEQHLAIARFRAVECGVHLVRATNTGISCVISPRGRIVHILEMGRPGILVARIPLPDERLTFYARFGDLFAYLLLVVSAGLLVFPLHKRGPQSADRSPQ